MKKLFVLGIALFFCLFFVGCSWVTPSLFIPDNGGMDEDDSQFIALLDKLNTPLKLITFLSTCHYEEHDGAYTPYEFYIGKEGDCVDLYMARWENIYTWKVMKLTLGIIVVIEP